MDAIEGHLREWTLRCRECGECLVDCRYLSLSRDEAVRAIRALNSGEPSVIHQCCISCCACDAVCPEDAHPYERIIARWNERYRRRGLPLRASIMMPTMRPNFRRDVAYGAGERGLHEAWASEAPPGPVVLFPGCNLLTLPDLATGALFEKLPVWGDWDQCCGEMYFRMGLFGPAEERAHRLTLFYSGKGVREMVFLCPACYNMFTSVLPERFGARFDFTTTHFVDYFTGALDRGDFMIRKRLRGSVVLQDSCHGRILGGDFMERQRALLVRLGLTVTEAPLNRERGLCCGMAAGCREYRGADILKGSLRALRELDRAVGDEIAVYCTGCLLTLSITRLVKPFGKRLVHTLELVRRALGEEPPRIHMKRAAALAGLIARHALPVYFSRKRFLIGV
ncbi:MAG: (Fe-S)-binding protein [Spirochaetes bacterium]|nr:(Fe-S)-binding protein [Spirochaetota bacterium]